MRRIVLSIFVITSIYSTCAIGNVFSDRDWRIMFDLEQRANVLGQSFADLRPALHGQPKECIVELDNELDRIHSVVSQMRTLVLLSSAMSDYRDEQIVDHTISLESTRGLQALSFSRQSVNETLKYCANSAIVATKGESMLAFITAIESVLRQIADRVI